MGTTTLRYNISKGIYISNDNRDGNKTLLYPHDSLHARTLQFDIPEEDFKVSVWSNFGCAYYMYAVIYYREKQLLDFNPQKIFVLNHRELSKFYVSATMGLNKSWNMMFELIIDVFNNREMYYQYEQPQISSYFNTLIEVISAQAVNVWGSWDINRKPTKWMKPLLCFSLFSNNLQVLLQETENDCNFYAKYKKDIILICETFIMKFQSIFNYLDFHNHQNGVITIEERLVRTFDTVHNYLESHGESLTFITMCLCCQHE